MNSVVSSESLKILDWLLFIFITIEPFELEADILKAYWKLLTKFNVNDFKNVVQ